MSIAASDEFFIDKWLQINTTDRQQFDGISAGSRRLHGRIDYQLMYILKGTCFVMTNNHEQRAEAGTLILYPPLTPQIYRFDATIPSAQYYVHFSGTACEELLAGLTAQDSLFLRGAPDKEIEQLFSALVREYHLKRPFGEQTCNGILVSLLAAAARRQRADFSDHRLEKQTHLIYEICAEMHKNYRKNLSVDSYAAMAHFSTDWFTHLFKKTVGVSPQRYLQNIRLQKSRTLLQETDLSVKEIAEMVGFCDDNYFSRFFKKETGKTPRVFRETQ